MKPETYEWMKMIGGTMIGNQNFITFRNNDFCTEFATDYWCNSFSIFAQNHVSIEYSHL